MKNEFSKLNRYEMVSLIRSLIDENEELKVKLDEALKKAETECRIDRDMLKRIAAALDRTNVNEASPEGDKNEAER